jgi:large subunit ribosomal protein L23
MTKHDIRNYLEKIYKIPVVDVRTVIAMGRCNS